MKEPILIEIAEKLNKSPAQVALRWGIQSGHSVLPKSVNESRIKENLSLFDWSIPPELFSKFSGIHQVNIPCVFVFCEKINKIGSLQGHTHADTRKIFNCLPVRNKVVFFFFF